MSGKVRYMYLLVEAGKAINFLNQRRELGAKVNQKSDNELNIVTVALFGGFTSLTVKHSGELHSRAVARSNANDYLTKHMLSGGDPSIVVGAAPDSFGIMRMANEAGYESGEELRNALISFVAKHKDKAKTV